MTEYQQQLPLAAKDNFLAAESKTPATVLG
jgi:hypothetical protein